MKKPCKECPFRKKAPSGYIGGHADAAEIFDIIQHDGKFPCHLEVNDFLDHFEHELDDDDCLAPTRDQLFEQAVQEVSFCAGSIIFMNNTGKLSRNPEIAKLQSKFKKSNAVFCSSLEFLKHHKSARSKHEHQDS